MIYWFTANLIVALHLGFICFVIFGGLLILKWRWVILFHVPAAVWGALIEYQGWLCPLTPLELKLRQASGQSGYSGGFIEHYLLPILYPDYLNQDIQVILGSMVVVINLGIYAWIFTLLIKKGGGTL